MTLGKIEASAPATHQTQETVKHPNVPAIVSRASQHVASATYPRHTSLREKEIERLGCTIHRKICETKIEDCSRENPLKLEEIATFCIAPARPNQQQSVGIKKGTKPATVPLHRIVQESVQSQFLGSAQRGKHDKNKATINPS